MASNDSRNNDSFSSIKDNAMDGEATSGSSDSAVDDSGGQTRSNDQDTSDSAIPSTPCVRICRYNADFYDGAVCIGCFREAFEIQTWASSTAQEKAYTLEDALDRLDDASGGGFEGSVPREELVRQMEWHQSLAQSDE